MRLKKWRAILPLMALLVLLSYLQASAVIIHEGESATFQFTLASNPSNLLVYLPNATAEGLFSFNRTLSVFDDLGEPPVFEQTINALALDDLIALFSGGFPGLFDDPVSYLKIVVTDFGWDPGATPQDVDFSPHLLVDQGTQGEQQVNGVLVDGPNPIPEPATMLLLGSGLLGLVGLRGKFRM